MDFESAKLQRSAHLSSVNFNSSASFKYVKFGSEANFDSVKHIPPENMSTDADFTRATFAGSARFTGAIFGEQQRTVECKFLGSTFEQGANFSFANFNGPRSLLSQHSVGPPNSVMRLFLHERIFQWRPSLSILPLRGPQKSPNVLLPKELIPDELEQEKPAFGDDASLSFFDAKIENPEKVSFHTLTLAPSWFINVDPRKFTFTRVRWKWRIGENVKELKRQERPHELLSIAYRNLALKPKRIIVTPKPQDFVTHRWRCLDARHGTA